MQTIIMFHNSKWYSPIWATLFALSLFFLWANRKKWHTGYDAFFWLIVISVGIIYCPLLSKALVPRFLPTYAEYERLSWVFFEIPLLSYVVIKLAKRIVSKKYRLLFIAAFLIVLTIVGSPDNRNFFDKPKNHYKIPQDSLVISNKLDELSPDGYLAVCIQVNSVNAYSYGAGFDGAFYYGLRMYNSRLKLRYVVVSQKQYNNPNFTLSDSLSQNKHLDYYICPKAKTIYDELKRLGYCYIDESEHFAIFYNLNKKKAGPGL